MTKQYLVTMIIQHIVNDADEKLNPSEIANMAFENFDYEEIEVQSVIEIDNEGFTNGINLMKSD